MRRAGLLHITDCPLERFNSLRRRGQLPFFDDSKGEERSDQLSKWQDFSLEDAFNLRLLMDLMDAEGVAHSEADYVVGNALRNLSMHPLNYPSSHGEMWVAGGVLTDPGGSSEKGFWRFHIAGRFGDLPGLAEGQMAGFPDSQLVRLTSVNASRAADFVRDKARELGLPEGDDYSQVWESARWPHWVELADNSEAEE
ncbi:MAG: hypothetical protein AAF675_05580 [Pseudomonadota bacterium]